MAGATVLAARAALRSGIGMVKLVVVARQLSRRSGERAARARRAVAARRRRRSSAISRIGPTASSSGRGSAATDASRELLERVLRAWTGPTLLDADALTLFERARRRSRADARRGRRCSRRIPRSSRGSRARRWTRCSRPDSTSGRPLATTLGAAVLLKGVPTVVTSRRRSATGERGRNAGARDRRQRRRAERNRRNAARATRRPIRRGCDRGVDPRTRRRAHAQTSADGARARRSTTSSPSCATAGPSIAARRDIRCSPSSPISASRDERQIRRSAPAPSSTRFVDAGHAGARGARNRRRRGDRAACRAATRSIASVDSAIENGHFQARLAHAARDRISRRRGRAERSRGDGGATRSACWSRLPFRTMARSPRRDLADGIGDAVDAAGTHDRGGNLSDATELSITTTVFGSAFAPLIRGGARAGDHVYVTGRLGGPARAIRHLMAGESAGRSAIASRIRCRDSLEARWLAERGATSAIDISDGLIADARHVAHASGVSIEIDGVMCRASRGVLAEIAVVSGEEYELVVTAPSRLDADAFAESFSHPAHADWPRRRRTARYRRRSRNCRGERSRATITFLTDANPRRCARRARDDRSCSVRSSSSRACSACRRARTRSTRDAFASGRGRSIGPRAFAFASMARNTCSSARGAVFIANHVSWFDIFALAAEVPWCSFVAKSELRRIPLFGFAAECAGIVFIDRENRKQAFESYSVAAAEVQRGRCVIVCPEGTRGYDYHLRPFKKGPFVLAIAAQAPVMPTLVYGSREVMPKGSFCDPVRRDRSAFSRARSDGRATTTSIDGS